MVGLVGFGHVGSVLAQYLLLNEYDSITFFDPFLRQSEKGSLIKGIQRVYRIEELVESCQIIFIAVADDSIEQVAKTLSDFDSLEEKIFLHTSGAHSSDVLYALKMKGARVASLHPLMVFNDVRSAAQGIKTCTFSYETDEQIPLIEQMLTRLKNPIMRLKKENKALYHAGACVVSNYLTTVLAYGMEMIQTATNEPLEQVWTGIRPLVQSVIDNTDAIGVNDALTGPLRRQDIQTVLAHYKQLGSQTDPAFYHQLVDATRLYMHKNHMPQEGLSPLDKAFNIENTFASLLKPCALAFDGQALSFQMDQINIYLMTFDRDVHIPSHQHGKQMGIVLEGQICVVVEGKSSYYVKGDVYVIDSGIAHESYISAGYKDLTLFEKN